MILMENQVFELTRQPFIQPGYSEEGSFDAPFEDYDYSILTREIDEPDEKLTVADISVSFGPENKTREFKVQTYFFTEIPEDE